MRLRIFCSLNTTAKINCVAKAKQIMTFITFCGHFSCKWKLKLRMFSPQDWLWLFFCVLHCISFTVIAQKDSVNSLESCSETRTHSFDLVFFSIPQPIFGSEVCRKQRFTNVNPHGEKIQIYCPELSPNCNSTPNRKCLFSLSVTDVKRN